MRIALVCPYDLAVPGGVQTHVLHLARQLESSGDTVLVIAPGEPGGDGDAPGTVGVGRPLGVRFNGSVAPLALSPAAARRTLDSLRRFGPDVVHVHEPAAPLVSAVATRMGPRPLVGTFHAWSQRRLLYRLARPLLQGAVRRLDVRIAVSPAAADYHARALGLGAGSFEIIPNGVDVRRFATAEPLPELREGDGPVLLFVGRLERRKGLELLVRAFVELRSARPDVRLVIVGDGPERDRCQALLPARLRADALFLGHVDQQTLPRVYASGDVVVVPAVGGESFGIVLLEAMAAGRPVVASDIPGFRALLRDGIDGRLVPPGDVHALTRALEALLANASLRRAMSEQAAATVAAYDWPAVTDRIRLAYRATNPPGGAPQDPGATPDSGTG